MQKKTRKQYSADFKAKVVKEMLREDKTIGQLAAEYGLHSNMLYRWRDQALAGLPGLFSDQAAQELAHKEAEWEQEREALYAQIGRLTTQVTWLEKKLLHRVLLSYRLKKRWVSIAMNTPSLIKPTTAARAVITAPHIPSRRVVY